MSRNEFLKYIEGSLQDSSFIKLTLSGYRGSDATLKNIYIRRAVIKREDHLSFTYRHATRDIVKNYRIAEGLAIISQFLDQDFDIANLFTTAFDAQINRGKIHKSKPLNTAVPSSSHDRVKERPIAAQGQHYLHALGITDKTGKVLNAAQDKYRQINKYIEILSGLIADIAPEKMGRIVDMGSGKGYLTFALYDYLRNVRDIPANICGVEYRADMVGLCNRISEDSGFADLSFIEGSIETYDATGINILIALHACDTATDDAIAKGIQAGAELIVVAPCCHKQIRREMEKSKTGNDLDFLTKYGTFLEREAEMVTDGIRALILNYFGYSTKVFEFISDAHTPKNVMIVGVKGKHGKDEKVLKDIKAAKEYFGISSHHLEKALNL